MTVVFYSTGVVIKQLLPAASSSELLALTKVFDEKAVAPSTNDQLAQTICRAGGHVVSNWFRNQGIPYSELLYDVAGHLKISAIEPLDKLTTSGLTIAEMDKRAMQGIVSPDVSRSWREPLNRYILGLEQEILKKFMSDSYGNMSAAERMRIDEQVAELGKTLPGTGVLGLSGAAAFMVVANAGGFATYILMSSVISALTVGAGFGLYTAAASTLNVLLGPVGWAALGIASAYKLGGPDAQACVKAVLALAMLRGRAIKA